MEKSKLYIAGFESNSIQPNSYNLLLASHKKDRKLYVLLNKYEAQVISNIIGGGNRKQLYAYGSMGSILHSLNIKLKKVELKKNAQGKLSAFIFGIKSIGVPFDSTVRPVDALILSLLNNCPIYFTDYSDTSFSENANNSTDLPLEDLSLDALKVLLEKHLAAENYEEACTIRDLMQERQ